MIDANLIFSNPLKYGNYKYIQSHYPDEYNDIIKISGRNFSEKLYKYLTNISVGYCIMCGKPTKFLGITQGYSKYCCHKCSCADPERQKKIASTTRMKYGVDNISYLIKHKPRTPQTTAKIAATKLERYGDPSYNNRAKSAETKLERYGNPNYNNFEAISSTKLKRYGDPNYNNRAKAVETTLERYGVDNVFRMRNVFEKSLEARKQSDAYQRVAEHNINRAISRHEDVIDCQDGVFTCVCPHPNCQRCQEKQYKIAVGNYHSRKAYNIEPCTKLLPIQPTYSTFELKIRAFLDRYNIEYQTNVRNLIPGELDIYIPSHHLAIECNGIYWHCDIHKSKSYHSDKYRECLKQGIQLITVWEDQMINYPEKIENLILSKLGIYQRRIYGRQCEVREISKKEARYILQHHLQGEGQSSIKLGLYYKNDLVSVMTFGKKRIIMGGLGEKSEYELIRFCAAPGCQIIGGAGKLLKYFISRYNPSKIVSFSSNDISIGLLYKTLKFAKINESESYWYIDKSMKRYHRYNFRKSRLVEMGYDANLTENEITKNMGLYRIYDSGQTRWELNISK